MKGLAVCAVVDLMTTASARGSDKIFGRGLANGGEKDQFAYVHGNVAVLGLVTE